MGPYGCIVKVQEYYIVSFLQHLSSVQGIMYLCYEELISIDTKVLQIVS